ncbi:MAG: four helix bundle protein [Cytophagaceae bacterium]|nr:four helix bundle protein [Cytophagaceae bacterium]
MLEVRDKKIRSYKDLEVFKLSYKIAMDIFFLSKKFPKEETYSLTSQIIRSSRSISANITEGWAKRSYENVFKQHLVSSLGSCAETINWLEFAKDCQYINEAEYNDIEEKLNVIGKMLNKLHQNWKTRSKIS